MTASPDRHGAWLGLFWLALASCVGVRPDTAPAGSNEPTSAGGRKLQPVAPSALSATSGELVPAGDDRFEIHSPTLRAELGRLPRAAAELAFVYRGPTKTAAPLASGEMRRQIGLKLRARDTCNVVYVMWHIEPSPGIVVSVKSNPGQRTHQECSDRGYSFLQPRSSDPVPRVQIDEPHVLSAEIRGRDLWVTTDGQPSWVGELPAAAFEFDGPVGLRADNGEFSAQLRAEKLAQE